MYVVDLVQVDSDTEVAVPGGKAGVMAEDMIELYDVMQTALDMADTQAHHTHFARSLVPQLSGGKGDPNRAAFSEGGYNIYEPQCFPSGAGGMYEGKQKLQNEEPLSVSRSSMVRTRTHKLIVRPQGQSELYSYADDPQERNNLYGDRRIGAGRVAAEVARSLHRYHGHRALRQGLAQQPAVLSESALSNSCRLASEQSSDAQRRGAHARRYNF